jgi:tRNA-specific 2-thiouridylase
LPNKDRKDSQGICFLGKVRYPEFVRHYLGEKAGDIVERETGRTLGTHRGFWFYTIGQRQGLGLAGGPWYVVAKDTEHNVIYVSHKEHIESNSRSTFALGELHWIAGRPATDRLSVKIRHGPQTVPATVRATGDGRLEVAMDRPDGGVAPGQFGVLYDGDVCLGAGKIL